MSERASCMKRVRYERVVKRVHVRKDCMCEKVVCAKRLYVRKGGGVYERGGCKKRVHVVTIGL